MEIEMSELDRNVLGLRWMQEDYGYLVDVALDSLLDGIEAVRETNPEVALYLSRTYAGEKFWQRTLDASFENHLEVLAEEETHNLTK